MPRLTRPQRVLLTVPRLNIGGAESYVVSAARHLRERGYDVVLASGGGTLARELAVEGFRHYWLPVKFHVGIAGRLLANLLRSERIDLVHANSIDAARATAMACRVTGTPWLMTAHGFIRRSQQRCLTDARQIICVSKYQYEIELQHKLFVPSKLVTLYNGIDLEQFTPSTDLLLVRAEWGFTADDFVLGIVSRITNTNGKGHGDLFRMLATDSRAAAWKLVVVGKGQGLSLLKGLAYRLGIANRVRFIGFQSQVARLYAGMNVVCLPSSIETFGLTLAEGMAMAKPAVAYTVGGMPEVVEDGVTGYLVSPGDVEMLATRLDSLRCDPIRARAMGACGRERVKRLFSLETMLDRLEDIYAKALRYSEGIAA